MRRRIPTLSIALALAASLAACGPGETEAPRASVTPSYGSEAPKKLAPPAPSETQAVETPAESSAPDPGEQRLGGEAKEPPAPPVSPPTRPGDTTEANSAPVPPKPKPAPSPKQPSNPLPANIPPNSTPSAPNPVVPAPPVQAPAPAPVAPAPPAPAPSTSSAPAPAPVPPSFVEPTSKEARLVGCKRDANGNVFVDIDFTVSGGRWSVTTQYNPGDVHENGEPYTRRMAMLTSKGVVDLNATWTYQPNDIGTITLFDTRSGAGHRYLPSNPVTVTFASCG